MRRAPAGPGPVVLGLPEDMLSASAEASPTRAARRCRRASPGAPRCAPRRQLLGAAERPLRDCSAAAGGARRQRSTSASFAERFDLPVGCRVPPPGPLRQPRTASYVGDVGIGINPKLAAAIKAADLLLLVGGRLGDMATPRLHAARHPRAAQYLVHVHPGAEELGRVYRPDLPIRPRRRLRRGAGTLAAAGQASRWSRRRAPTCAPPTSLV